ncbi:ATP-binding protein [Georgenia ruanii]|uniref:ATP-binding protein n=1 Tax=Georgenia ruanii TaxID=348442 RepID=A0A7J9UY34_9MICO|nr:ATP-binding protein [Georgenia ruanii]MPV89548.1 ATP-binding protein [Georgenia ruanii]
MTSRLRSESTYPPEEFERLARWVLDGPKQLAGLRAGLTDRLRQAGAQYSGGLTGVADQMVLVASELATNALVHGLPPTLVDLMATDEEFLLDVVDHAPDDAPELAEERPPGEGGLGLQIATRMAMDVGWFTEGAGKHVWARFPRD